MDEGPFRVPRSADRRSSQRAEPAAHQAEEPQPVKEEPKPVHHTVPHRHVEPEKKSRQRFVLPVVTLLVGIVVGAGGWFALSHLHGSTATINSSEYQAVSFTDGQLYFGKLSIVDGQHLKLTDVYYLQQQTSDTSSSADLQKSTNNQNFKLVKFTDVIYGPEDEITIPKSQVLFYENLKPDGKVTQLINQYKDSH